MLRCLFTPAYMLNELWRWHISSEGLRLKSSEIIVIKLWSLTENTVLYLGNMKNWIIFVLRGLRKSSAIIFVIRKPAKRNGDVSISPQNVVLYGITALVIMNKLSF